MNKATRYIIGVLAVLVIIFLSLDIQNLDDYKSSHTEVVENAEQYALNFWENQLPEAIESAISISDLVNLLNTNPDEAYGYGYVLGISRTHSFMVKGQGEIISIEDEYILIHSEQSVNIRLATDFIFGNTVRDGSGKVNIDNFLNMTAFNNVSVAINKLVKQRVVQPLKSDVHIGEIIEFAGATDIHEDNSKPDFLNIIPVSFHLSEE